MTIIDYAAGQPAPGPGLKEVTFYLNGAGEFAIKGTHAQEVHAIVSADDNQQTIERNLQLSSSAKFQASKELATNAIKNAADLNSLQSLFPALKDLYPNLQIEQLDNSPDLDQYRSSLMEEIDKVDSRSMTPIPTDQFYRPTTPRIDFGPPTQFNGMFGGGILQEQQRLNTVPFSNRN